MSKDLEKLLGIKNCKDCDLSKNRKNIVIGEGNEEAEILLVGEAPGKKEDQKKQPFVGKAGELLDDFLSEINLNREEIYITNIVKCKPPSNRNPKKKEMSSCDKYLKKQIKYINPSLILSVGRIASKRMKNKSISVQKKHGTLTETTEKYGKRKLFITYHPAACLYNNNLKSTIENDFEKLRTYIDTLKEFEV